MSETTKYKFNGPKNPAYDNTEILDLGDGRVVTVGGEVELSDDEHKQYAGSLKFSKVSDSGDSASEGEGTASASQDSASGGNLTRSNK